MSRRLYSIRTGKNKNSGGFDLGFINNLFVQLYNELRADGYFNEYHGWYCADMDEVPEIIPHPEYDITIKSRKENLWPIYNQAKSYSEDDLFDVIEYLFTVVSKPIEGQYHSFNNCGMHWETFNKDEGEKVYRDKVNEILSLYKERFELSEDGEILRGVDQGFERIFAADIPTRDDNVRGRIDSAVSKFRHHSSTVDDRRHAVRDLADVLEYLRPHMDQIIDKKDESDLFNIANNFGIRHHNDKQKTGYDAVIWLSWMFYFYLSTIHVVLRKINAAGIKTN